MDFLFVQKPLSSGFFFTLKRNLFGCITALTLSSCAHHVSKSSLAHMTHKPEIRHYYPIPSIPRYYRDEMGQALKRWAKTPEEKSSANAYSYWYQRWVKNHPEEVDFKMESQWAWLSYRDLQYGMARLDQQRSTHNEWSYYFDVYSPRLQQNPSLSASFEAQLWGPLAILMLKKLGHTPDPSLSPLAQLAKLQNATPQRVNGVLQKYWIDRSVAVMTAIDPRSQLDQRIGHLANKNSTYLVIPIEKVPQFEVSSFFYSSFFHFPRWKDVRFYPLDRQEGLLKPQKHSGDFLVYVEIQNCTDGPGLLWPWPKKENQQQELLSLKKILRIEPHNIEKKSEWIYCFE